MQTQYLPLSVMEIDAGVKIPDTFFAREDPSFVVGAAQRDSDARALMLTEVDLKWLMAGQGWWINTERFHFEPSYAAGILHSALASPCDALRACAATLQAQLDCCDLCRPRGPS